ncbi:MAG: ABC transporter permease [Pseudomonadota bacterium]
MRFFSLAWRNVLRHRERNGFTLVAIALGVAALTVAWALFDGSNAQMVDNMTGHYTGHVQVHRAGYVNDPSLERTFGADELPTLPATLREALGGESGRLEASALASAGDHARGVRVVGVDATREPTVTALGRRMVQGTYLDHRSPGDIVLGRALARALGVELGSMIELRAQGAGGHMRVARYRLQGIYDTGSDDVDSRQAFIALADAQALLLAPGVLSTLVLRLHDRQATESVATQLRAVLGPAFEVHGWPALLPEVAQSIAFHETVGYGVMALLFGIVAIGVANTLWMSVLSRRSEFGVMLALGTRPSQVFVTLLWEGGLIGVLGSLGGLAAGSAVAAWAGHSGLSFDGTAQALQSLQGATSTLHPQVRASRLVSLGGGVLAVSVLAALYPAWRAARLTPWQALQGLSPGSWTRRGLFHRLFGGSSGGRTDGVGAPSGAPAPSAAWWWTLAWRNLTRHPSRTGLTVLALIFGLGAFIFLASFATGYQAQIVNNATSLLSGDAQLQHPDFQATLQPRLTLPDGPRLLAWLPQLQRVVAASPRVQAVAVLNSAMRSERVMMLGVDPVREPDVTSLSRTLVAGRYLRRDDDQVIVIGRRLAQLLDAGVGTQVMLTAQGAQGLLASQAYTVVGLFDTGSQGFDQAVAHVPLAGAQRLLQLDEAFHSIGLRLADRAQAAATLQGIRALMSAPRVKLLTWQALLPEVARMSRVIQQVLGLLLAIVFAMVCGMVLNTVLLSLSERRRDFATLLALGGRPVQIVRLVLFEAGALGVVGAIGGAVLGTVLSWGARVHGISLRTHAVSAMPGTTDIVYPQLTLPVVLWPALSLPLVVMLVCLVPAMQAAPRRPVRALHWG